MASLSISNQSRGLLSLAPELIEAISEYLDLESVKEFRLTCKSLGEQLTSAVFRAVSIEINRYNYEKALSKLTVLSTAKHAACTSTRKLSVRSLAPSFDPNYGPVWTYADGQWREEPTPDDSPEILLAEQEVEECLYDAIASFKGVRSVSWNPCVKDNETVQKAVFDALKTLPNLRRLHINLHNCKIPLELEAFKGLQDISIAERSANYQVPILDSLAKLIAQNSDITSVNLSNGLGGHHCSQNLHQLFKYYPTHATPLRLRHLGLRSWQMLLDEITLPHLKYLTSLDIISIKVPNAINKKEKHGSSPEDVWKTLHSSEIHLEEISLDIATPSFIDYLSSYTGLRKLKLSPGIFSDKAESDEMAKRFFAEAFTNHVLSLEELLIAPGYEGLWCFGSHNMELISKSTRLRLLGLSIISSELGFHPNSNILKLMIDMAVTCMPHIEEIDVSAANLESLRGARCGNPAMSHFKRVNEKLDGCLREYRAPLSCRRLPTLRITSSGGQIFVGNRGLLGQSHGSSEVEEPLRYTLAVDDDVAW